MFPQRSGLFRFLFKKENQVESLLYDYLEAYKMARENFREAFQCAIETPQCEAFEFLIGQTHKYESKADDIREEIKALMYSKALIPESRGDLMGLLESIDEIPRIFEKILSTIQTQKLILPDFIIPDIQELVRISLECCDLLTRQVDSLIKRAETILSLLNAIDTHESHCDHLERMMISKVFSEGIDPFQKLQLKELIVQIGGISDLADRASRRINIINLKRRV
jgi:predicted phosphate transport protein (TIGR00153 family)